MTNYSQESQNQNQENLQQMQENSYNDPSYFNQPVQGEFQTQPVLEEAVGPRKVGLFMVIIKTFLGFVGGVIGSIVLLLIFLGSASILQPILSPAESTVDQLNPIFMALIIAMIFITALISSLMTPFLLSISERDQYPRINTALFQIFLINLVILFFCLPIYLSASVGALEFIAYAAGLQIVLVSLSAALIMEIVNDKRYPLMAVYSSVLGVLVAVAINLILYKLMSSPTVLLFAVLPIVWGCIAFFQGAGAGIYSWYYTNWGMDFLSSDQTYGVEYGDQQAQEEVEEEEKVEEDKNGGDFFKS